MPDINNNGNNDDYRHIITIAQAPSSSQGSTKQPQPGQWQCFLRCSPRCSLGGTLRAVGSRQNHTLRSFPSIKNREETETMAAEWSTGVGNAFSSSDS
ncbi:molybdopterin-guanine dinucleotide biosynthesis protein A [Anopheles sinensis]|uniref:Molybdopterin-guanine dinucleotide biosynthesis protein A n=1 Tax=Anopheles sinensis TaxID=74873 RepID=A0A084VFW2_ANOSI|nr:molybdopterin-guanine dinucleotide biosynthesis protein A [Anopheles sinensis]